jgi:hypothetical protein
MIDQHAVSAVGSPLQQRHHASRQRYEPQRHAGQNLIGNHTSLPPQRSESTLLPISIGVRVRWLVRSKRPCSFNLLL